MDNFFETLKDGVLLCKYLTSLNDIDRMLPRYFFFFFFILFFLFSSLEVNYRFLLHRRLVNDIKEGSVKKINLKINLAFKCMENINAFLEAARVLGVPAQETFQTVDLWERQNLNSVVICLQSLGRKVHGHVTSYSSFNSSGLLQIKRFKASTVKYVLLQIIATELLSDVTEKY